MGECVVEWTPRVRVCVFTCMSVSVKNDHLVAFEIQGHLLPRLSKLINRMRT